VSFREHPAAAELFVHPLADLEVRQRVVPLARDISRFGNADVDGEHRFEVAVVGTNNAVLSDVAAGVQRVNEFFAPAQFRAMTDDEKLAAPAFESMQAGMRFSLRTYTSGNSVSESEMTYERDTAYRSMAGPPAMALALESEIVLDETAAPAIAEALAGMPLSAAVVDRRGVAPFVVQAGLVERVASIGAAARAPLARSGTGKYTGASRGIALKPPRFAAVSRGRLKANVRMVPSYAEVVS
jgi:hypothetical protein